MKIFAKVSYFGKNYHGWQIQPNGNSVEEEIEKVLSKILNNETKIFAAGRTDAGVHAKGQTFHFETKDDVDVNKLRYSLNQLLPDDIHIDLLSPVDDDFHARFSAIGKHYQYIINRGEKDPFIKDISWYYPYPFDVNKFKEALDMFIGEHNFSNFTSKEEDEGNFVRIIESIDVGIKGNLVVIDLVGNGFMRYMIRDIIGTAIAYASNKIDINYISDRLTQKERNITSYKANSEGLFLIDVIY